MNLTVERTDADLLGDASRIRVDDRESFACGVRGINAATLRVDGDVIEAAKNR